MTATEQTVRALFSSLDKGDFRTAGDCYQPDARFHDIAFDLEGKDKIAAMWRLVCSRNVKVSYRDIRADQQSGTAHWESLYRFSRTNRLVHHKIDSTFLFRDGKISLHLDRSSRWAWAHQALGFPRGLLVTMLPFLLRNAARKELEEFVAGESIRESSNGRSSLTPS